MSVGIIIKGKPTYKPDTRKLSDFNKDAIHNRRKEVEYELRKTIFSKDKMDQRDVQDKDGEERRVREYDQWKKTPTKLGKTNEQLMSEWGELNREFKRRGEEGKPMCLDFVRQRKSTKYE